MKPLVLLILDGWGSLNEVTGNAIANTQTPNIDLISKEYPKTLLQASGKAVGMAWGEPGNSEVGHLTIGSGRVIFQYLSKINRSIEDGSFNTNPALIEAIDMAVKTGGTVHLAGLLTSGSVHAFFEHPIALIKLAHQRGANEIRLHIFADGKDSELREVLPLIEKLKSTVGNIPFKISTLMGRDLAMNRTGKWDKTQIAFNLIHSGQGQTGNVSDILVGHYGKNLDDAEIPAILVDNDYQGMNDGDTLIFWNFREDSMRQITRAFNRKVSFDHFERGQLKNTQLVTMTPYLEDASIHFAFSIDQIKNGLAEVISAKGLAQLHLAETEKYAHVTYFFNCLHNKPFPGEEDIIFDSVADTMQNPEMRVDDIANAIVEKIDKYPFIVANFANADLLAHLGEYEAAIKGVEAIDKAVGKVYEAITKIEGTLIITADHGNAESILYTRTAKKETRHNDNPVPIYIVRNDLKNTQIGNEGEISGYLADVAPTILKLMNIEKPSEMTGTSLIN